MDDTLQQLGPRLRAARRERGLTLEALAERAGMSPSTLSRLEGGKRQASLELLVPLTRQLGIRIDDLLPGEPPDPRIRLAPLRRDGLLIQPLSPGYGPIRTFRIRYPPAQELPRPRVHDGDEWLYVLSGRLRLRLGERELTLGRGEAAQFDTRIPHAMAALGARPAEVLSIFNEEGAHIHARGEDD